MVATPEELSQVPNRRRSRPGQSKRGQSITVHAESTRAGSFHRFDLLVYTSFSCNGHRAAESQTSRPISALTVSILSAMVEDSFGEDYFRRGRRNPSSSGSCSSRLATGTAISKLSYCCKSWKTLLSEPLQTTALRHSGLGTTLCPGGIRGR